MAHKPLRPTKSLAHKSPDYTYLVAYKLHVVNQGCHELDPNFYEQPIDITLDEMAGLHVMGTVWIVETPGYSPKSLRDLLCDQLKDGDELVIAPLPRPDRVTGFGIKDALKVLSEWSSAVMT